MLDDMLRDRLMFGVSDKRIQNSFLHETSTTLSYSKARDMALAADAAQKDCKQLQDERDNRSPTSPAAGGGHVPGGQIAHVGRHPRRVRPEGGASH